MGDYDVGFGSLFFPQRSGTGYRCGQEGLGGFLIDIPMDTYIALDETRLLMNSTASQHFGDLIDLSVQISLTVLRGQGSYPPGNDTVIRSTICSPHL